MRAALMYGAGDVRIETVDNPTITEPTDAIVRITAGCICGSDLWPYASRPASVEGSRMGHEFVGVITELGSAVTSLAVGDFVIAPFVASCGSCDFCSEGLQTSCRNGAHWGGSADGGQGEMARVPQADGTLVKVPAGFDVALLPSLLALSDVMATGYHAAAKARIVPGQWVTVIGDGAVGLCAVISAKLMGAGRIILMGRHESRTNLGREFGATDVVPERGEAGIKKMRELTNGDGTHVVLEAVGLAPALEMAIGAVRDGGTISRVGAPQFSTVPLGFGEFMRNITLTGGVAPARAYIDELLPLVLDGSINPGKVFDRTITLDEVPAGYAAMAAREALKVLVRP
ncbi:zinc-binding dehydrogenase [Paeniglutamicibacter terrestris]|uniref:Alcohol dehydrogenase catalytic domain-containing protein n=1 Tax=Paeniglutamicibacter terrestris TaxID=2723403 RepID=A0ABX1G1C5_9MICC|nr:alcohol dehydrogenase catalytic domain-containing protein [Paeniglutamicibacter terrestris]NKG19764.1 alcohol dehydrogenase catalytic domain-containing protein [Paeniglutamicibacter terrestris]